ncbi:hypothetical protein ACOME3_008434 [Neoechinorhynchus agilis]
MNTTPSNLKMNGPTTNDQLKRYAKIALVVALYWFTSIGMVFVNKYLLTDYDSIPEAPLFITWFQCALSVLFCYLIQFLIKLNSSRYFNSITPISFDISTSLNVLPVSVFFVAMMSFNNLTLKHMSVSFYMVGRSLTTVFNVVLSYLILKSKISRKTLLACAIVISGFFIGIDQESLLGTLTRTAVVCGVISSACVALNAIYTKKVLVVVEGSVWRFTYFNNLNATFLFLPLIIFNGELKLVTEVLPILYVSHFWLPMVVAAFLGFCMSFVTGLQITVTSPLTHNISGTAKAYAQTFKLKS